MDIQGLSKIRSEVIRQVQSSREEPFDIAFVQNHNGIFMCPLDLKGDFPSSFKYTARKQVLNKFLNKEIRQAANATALAYFSFDPILNVDYCFEVFPTSKHVNLYVYTTAGIKVCEFKAYDPNYDERKEIDRSIKAGKGQPSSFASLKERFSKLLGINKPEQLNIAHSSEPIAVSISEPQPKVKPAKFPKEPEPKPQPQENTSSFVEDVLSRMDTPRFQAMRSSGIGFAAISMTLSMFTNQMISMYPEWDGLFDFDSQKDHVRVVCKKGFDDRTTRMAIPYLWKRRSFIENCILFGVEKIVFQDPISRTFDLLEVSKVNPNILKEA